MKALVWFAVMGVVAGLTYLIVRWRRQWAERAQAAEQRMAMLIAQAKPSVPTVSAAPQPAVIAPQERLLLEAATKAGEAGEPVLCIQLYAKLLSRYPQTSFAAQARAAVEVQKKKLAKP
jgi:hypothetical protein